MARPTIIEKLKRELQQEITAERQVVYILAEIRKLLEVTEEADNYFALNFYCSWALHTRMSRDGALRILERFDQAHGETVKVLPPDPKNLRPETWREIQDTMAYVKFRLQMEKYLQANDLPLGLVHCDLKWTTFLSFYTEVIEECPLQLAGQGIDLQHIAAVTVFKIREGWQVNETDDGIVLFGAEWRLTCKNPSHNGSHSTLFVIPRQPSPAG
jgi:hypothetical protein